MEDLMDLVAASFLRHGIECPTRESKPAQEPRAAEPFPPTALPEHSYRKRQDSDPAT